LLELSSVAIPACAACLIEQRACGGHAAGACGCGGDLTLEVSDWGGVLGDLADDADGIVTVFDERTGRVVPLGRDALDAIIAGRLRGLVNGSTSDALARVRRGR
jgi:hypothetical protein